jgi:uncharacterized protein (DUF58 family)
MRRYLVAAAVVALLVPALAAAKGPSGASISGPGLDRSLTISGDGEGLGTQLGNLAMRSGFFAQMFGQTPDPTLRARPAGKLGARYTVVYVVPGPNNVMSHVVQRVYPFAKPVALTYMKPGQPFWQTDLTHGGWYKASLALKRILIRAGVPATAPS